MYTRLAEIVDQYESIGGMVHNTGYQCSKRPGTNANSVQTTQSLNLSAMSTTQLEKYAEHQVSELMNSANQTLKE